MNSLCRHLLVSIGGALWAEAVCAGTLVKLESVVPSKILFDAGEPVSGRITVANVSQEAQTVTVRAWLEWRIDRKTEPQEKKLTVQPEQTATASFTWKELPDQFGHALRAEVLLAGEVVEAGEGYFQITDNIWKTALIAAIGKYGKSREDLDRLYREYYNVYEIFFWAPDDFLELTPEVNSWYSGQARYHCAIEGEVAFPKEWKPTLGLKDLIAYGHERGMRAITYAKLTGCGPVGFEAARRNPQIMWHSGGVLSVSPDAETLAKWDDRTVTELPTSWLPVNYNMNDPAVVDIGIKELADSADLFGWDGARWDGNFAVRSEVYDLEGNLLEKLTAEQKDARTAENMRRAKERISRRHPNYVYGYNYIGTTVTHNLLAQPRETAELCRGGGLLMNEYIRGAANVNHPLHDWRRYAETLVADTERIKRMGGYMGPIPDLRGDDADSQYKAVFIYAAGAHPYYQILFGKFMTRYSFYCWDPNLRQVSLPETIVQVAGNVWWEKWVFRRTLSPGHEQLVVHLINPPTAAGVEEQKELPPPQQDVRVMYYPFGRPGWRLERVTRLDVASMTPEVLAVENKESVLAVTVPEVTLWNLLVFDLVKGEALR